MDVSVKLLSPMVDLYGCEGFAARLVKITYGGAAKSV
jgi:hypothetical protein